MASSEAMPSQHWNNPSLDSFRIIYTTQAISLPDKLSNLTRPTKGVNESIDSMKIS